MNLQHWIAAEHASLLARTDSAITLRVPVELWAVSPPGGGSSLTWLLFHITYHQDLALNTAIRNQPPLLASHRSELGLEAMSCAAGLAEQESFALTEALPHEALMAYVDRVNQATTEWITRLSAMALESVPNVAWRLEHKALVSADEVPWLYTMWADKPVAWFVQWECLAHRHNHLGEMTAVRNRLGFSPF